MYVYILASGGKSRPRDWRKIDFAPPNLFSFSLSFHSFFLFSFLFLLLLFSFCSSLFSLCLLDNPCLLLFG